MSTKSWTAITREKAPSERSAPSLVWTGDRLIVWGGYHGYKLTLNTGGVYYPGLRRWEKISDVDAPSARYRNSAVWTGSEMIIYGGDAGGYRALNTGAAFDPKRNVWRTIEDGPLSSSYQSAAIWAGTEMIVRGDDYLEFYDPFHDRWSSDEEKVAFPPGFNSDSLYWTGVEVIFWDGKTNTGYLFYP